MANDFISGYYTADEALRRRNTADMQQAQGMLQMQGMLQKQVIENKYRDAIAKARTPEEAALIAAQAAGPEGVLRHADTQARIQANKEATLSRIKQSADQFDTRMELALREAKRKEDRDAVLSQWERGRLEHQNAALRMTGERLFYDTGIRLPTPQVPQTQPEQTQQPGGISPEILAGRPPAEQAAIQAVSQAGATPMTVDVGNYQPPQPAPQTVPQPTPAIPPQVAPLGNEDMQDRRIAAAARENPQPVETQQVVSPSAPQMPQFQGSPREVARARNRWLMEQSKPGAGGTASEVVVDAIANGRMPVPSGFALRSPYWQDVIERAAKKNPNFDASTYVARSAARRTFASGPEARNVTSLNTVIGHLGTLDEAASALQNQDIRAFNAVANRLATEMGDPRIVNFNTAKQAVAEETMRVFRQVGASEEEARRWGEIISSSSSPAQLRGNIKTLGDLLDSRVQAIAQQYERTVTQGGNPARVDPKNLQTLDRLRGGGRPKISGDAEYNALPSGTEFVAPDGSTRRKP